MPDSTLTPEQTQALLQQLLSDGKQPPAKLGDLELVRDPTTGQPIAYRDPNTGSTISIPQPTTTTRTASDPNTWQPVYRVPGDVSSGQVGTWDPANNEFHAVAAAPGAPATGKFDPVVVTDTAADGTRTTRQVGMIDTGDKSFHPLAAAPDAKPSGTYDNVYVTNADGSKRLVGMTDKGDKRFIALSADPTTQKRTIQTPTAVYSVDDNDNVKKLVDIDKSSPFQAVVIDGVAYRFDPNEKDPTKAFTQVGPSAPLPQTIKDGAGNTLVLTDQPDGSKKYQLPPGVKAAAQVNVNTTARYLDYRDEQGNLVKREDNPNYVEPKVDQPNLPAPNAVVPRVLVPDPDKPGNFKWIDNEGRVTASAALQNLASSLSGQVVDGKISVDEAKAIIDGANTTMQTATTAATQALDYTSRGAQAGAGILQQRAQAAQGAFQGMLDLAGRRPLYAGAPDVSGLSGAISNWTAGLMGGQDTLNAAANMVKAAAPDNAGSPMAAAASGALTQILQKWSQANGGALHPIEQAHQAALSSAQTGGVTAPSAAPVPQPVGPSVPVQMPQVASGQVAPSGAVPGQNYGAATAYTGGVAPWNAAGPQPFVAPSMPFGAIGANPMANAMSNFVAPSAPVQPPTVTIRVGG